MYFKVQKKRRIYHAEYCKSLSPDPHVHTHIEMILLDKGITLATADRHQISVAAGDLFVAFPNQIHYYTDQERPLGCSLLIVSPEICPEFSKVFKSCLPVSPVLHGALDNPRITDAVNNLIRISKERKENDDLLVRGYLLILFTEIFKALPVAESPCPVTDPVKDIIRYCYENYTENLSLESIAEALHISPCYVSHLFGKRLKIRFHDYLNALRIQSACEMLSNAEKSVTEIAFSVGYNSIRSFDRCFLKIKGVTPKEYRKSHLPRSADFSGGAEKPSRK